MRKFIRDIIAKIKRPKNIGGDIRQIFAITYSVHNKMVSRYLWYDRWHQKPYAHKAHCAVLSVYVTAVFLGFILLFFQPTQQAIEISAESGTSLVAKDESGVFLTKTNEEEIVSERTRNFKKFYNSSAKKGKSNYRVAGQIGPIHYKDDPYSKTEEFKEINLNIRETPSKDWDYAVEENGYKIHIWNEFSESKEKGFYKAQFIRAGHYLEMAPLKLVWQNDKGDEQVVSEIIGGITPQIDNENYKITWKDAFGKGIDFDYNLSSDRFYKTVTINSKKALPELEIDSSGAKLVIVMATTWDEGVKTSNDFAKNIKPEKIKPDSIKSEKEKREKDKEKKKKEGKGEEIKIYDEEISNPKAFSFIRSDGKDAWWVDKPIAWDGSDGKQLFEMSQEFKRIDNSIITELGLSKEKIDQKGNQFPLYLDASIPEEQVGASSDDVFQTGASTNWGSRSLKATLIYLNSQATNYYTGFRWTSIPVEKDATIMLASFSPSFQSTSVDDPQVRIYGNDVDSAVTFAATGDTYNGRAKTDAYVDWQAVGVGASFQPSADISSIISEITSRAGWTTGNDLALVTQNISSSYSGRVYTYDQGSAYGAKLNITYDSPVTISGTVYTNEAKSANVGANKTVALSIDGGAITTDETDANGAFEFTGISGTGGKTITLFLDGETEKSNYISVSSGNDMTGIEMYTDKISLSHATAGPMTNTLLATADGCGDDDIAYSESSGNVDFDDGYEVWIEAGKTYTPGGTVELDDLEVLGSSATFNPAANAVTVNGSWKVNSAGVFTSSGTVTFTNASDTETLTAGGADASHDFQNLTKSGAGVLQLSTNALEVVGTLTVSSGATFDLNGVNLNSAPGTFSNSGTFKLQGGETCGGIWVDQTTGLIEYTGSGTYTGNCFNLSDTYRANNIKFSGSGNFNYSSSYYANGNIEVTAGTVGVGLYAGGYTQTGGTRSGSSPTTVKGDFTISSGSWTNTGGTLTIDAVNNDISFSASGYTFGRIDFQNSSSTNNRIITFGSGNYVFSEFLVKAQGSSNVTLDASVNNPNITSTTFYFTQGSGAGYEYTKLGDGTWKTSQDLGLTHAGALIPGQSTFIIEPTGTFEERISSNGNHFYNLIYQSSVAANLLFNGAFYIDGDLTLKAEGTSDIILVASGSVELGGNLDYDGSGSGSEYIGSGANIFYIGGNADFSGGKLHSDGTYVFNKASGTQTLNTGGTGSDNDFNSVQKSGGGSLDLSGNGLVFHTTLTIDSGCTVYANGQNISGTTNTLDNTGTLKLNGDESVSITNWDSDSGTVEYVATSGSRAIKDVTYYDLKINGSGGTFSLPATKTVNNLDIAAGTFDLLSYGLTVNGTFSNTDTLRLTGDGAASLTNDADSGTVVYNATSSSRSIKNWNYYNLQINGSGGTFNLPANTNIDGNLTITAGTLAANNFDINLAGNWSNSATFTPGTKSVILDGSGAQQITAGGTGAGKQFYDLTSTNSSASGVTFADSLTLTGTFACTTASAKLTFHAGSTYTLAAISLNGADVGTRIVMRSSSTSSVYYFNVAAASPTASYVDVQDSNASGGNEIDAGSGSYNSGNNTNWLFSITISGVCKQYDQSTSCADSETIKVAINSSLQAQTGNTSSGAWTISGVSQPSSGSVITVFVDGVADTLEANAVAKYDGSGDIENLDLFERHLNIGSSDNQTITNANLSQYDNSVSSDEDIFFEVDANNDLTVPATGTQTATDQEVIIKASNTYQPDSGDSGNVKTPNLEIPISATLTANANTIELTDHGTPFTKTGTFNFNTSTFKYTAGANTTITAADYYNLEIQPPAVSASCDYTVSGAGDASSNGNYSENGTWLGQPKYRIAGNGAPRWIYYESGSWVLYDETDPLWGDPSGGFYYSSSITGTWQVGTGTSPAPTVSACSASIPTYTFASGTVNIEGNYVNGDGTNAVTTTADTNDPTLNINGDFNNSASAIFIASDSADFSVASDFSNNATATFTHSSGTLTFDGQGVQSITPNGDSFNNITITNTSADVDQAGATTIAGTLDINSSTNYDLNGSNLTLATLDNDGTLKLQGGETVAITTMDTSSGEVEYTGSDTYVQLAAGDAYYNLTLNGSGSWTLDANLAVAGVLDINSGTFNASSRTVTLSGSGTPFVVSGTFTESTSTISYTGLSATNITGTTYNNLYLNQTGTTFTAIASITVSGVLTINAGTFDADDETIILSGTGTPFVKTGTFTASTSTIKYTGAGDTTIAAATYYNLETSPSASPPEGDGYWATGAGVSEVNGFYIQDGTYNSAPAYENENGYWIHKCYAGEYDESYWRLRATEPSGCPYGPATTGGLYYTNETGSLTVDTWWGVAPTQGGQEPAPDLSEIPDYYTYTFASGTVNIEGNYVNGDGTNAVTTTATTNDPTLNIDGAFSNSAGATFIASNSGTFSVGGNFTNNATGVFTHSNGELTLDGSSTQTITVAGDDFYNLTITNSGSAPDITFADSFGVDNQFKAITSDTTIRFTDGITATIVDLNLDGQDANYITLEGSGTGGWDLINTSQTDISYVSVSYSDASGGAEIDASNGTNYDGGNNTYWNFNTAPVNDSLTFTNPYSGTTKTAVADDTTEWNFEAKVTDDDGSTDIDYVEIRLANSSDSSQPYDSLKFRWTESTDSFSEQADTQGAATLTSDADDSGENGNQWTLNFKIKIDNDFLDKDTDYAIELYSIDDSSASDTDNYADKYQVKLLSISIEVDSPTIEFGNLLPGSVLTDTTVCTVTTNYPNGYSLSAHDNVAGGNSVLLHTDLATRIADYLGTITTPTSWSGTGLGISLYLATSKEAKWGSGTTETDSNNKYAGVPETATIIHEKTGSPTSADTNSVGYKLVVPNTQKTGNYSGTITYTATGVLN